MNDEQRTPDERIIAAARDLYNAPPETPRDEMWAAIESRLDSDVPLRSRGSSGSSRRPAKHMAWWIGIAAALVIGLGIGRLSMRTGPAGVHTANEPAVETTVAETPPAGPEDAAPESADRTIAEALPMEEVDDGTETDAADRIASADVERTDSRPAGSAPSDATDGAPRRLGLQYTVATHRLLDRGESFLATVQADLASGAPDPEMEMWARSLLSRTRVLMASPAAHDPETRRLLEDLELMLAQIVVTSATGDPGEIRILGEGLEDGNLRHRLRSATEDNSGPESFRTPRTSSL